MLDCSIVEYKEPFFFGLVRFLFKLQFPQEYQDLTTNPDVCKDGSISGQNGLERHDM